MLRHTPRESLSVVGNPLAKRGNRRHVRGLPWLIWQVNLKALRFKTWRK